MAGDLSLGELEPKVGRNFRWTLIAFVFAGLLMSGLAIWQLYETSPQRWCALAENTAGDVNNNACLAVLLKLLELKDHSLLAIFFILGITVISVVVVALKVQVRGSGPGGLSVDIGADKTVVEGGGSEVEIPTPPSEDKP